LSNATIFISYRRDDTSGHAGRLYDRLSARFGAERIFMDIDTIKPGVDFVTVIDDAVASCAVLIALIGNEWLTIKDAAGGRRLDNPHDFNRLEIESGLKRSTTVIPVLVEGARMPSMEDLPSTMAALARRNAIELSDVRWDYDVQRLITTIEEVVGEPSPPPGGPSRKKPPLLWLAAGALVLVVAVVAAFLLTQGGSPACGGQGADTASLANSQIAFLSDRDGNEEIYGMRADGTRQVRFTDDAVDELRADWAPDGKQLVFGAGSGDHAICVKNVDGSGAHVLTSAAGNEEAPDWSPDGTKIAFSAGSKSDSDIVIMKADGSGGSTNLTPDDHHRNRSPDWSRDDVIAFSSNRKGSFDIFTMPADGTEPPKRLTKGSASDGAPAWSFDGQQIVFPRTQRGASRLFVMNADGSDLKPLAMDTGGFDRSPAWSPDGQSIAFTRRGESGGFDIFRVNVANGSLLQLTSDTGGNIDPAWGPLP
jgi:Tol biopolymer transport system component